VFLAGDAAQGADPALLDTYETRRRPVAREVVKMTDRMTKAATLRGPAARVRNLALRGVTSVPAVRRAIAMNLSELSTDNGRPGEQAERAGHLSHS
jgi:2-polyprenyl-6-methoxyphenol hydroxylase-like FAD-dependent oxidoreductase